MKKLMVVFLVAVVAMVPALALAQTGGGATGGQKPGMSTPSEKPGGTSAPSTGQGTKPGGSESSPSASPPGGDMSKHQTKAACEKAGGMWSESTKACSAKK
jgi:hypothetical protein